MSTSAFTKASVFAFFAGIAAVAAADDITISRALDGATVQESGVDMSVFYTKDAATFEVTAVYVRKGNSAAPTRIQLRLMDGDRVSFSLPGGASAAYTFARTGSDVTVTARSLWMDVAAR